MTTKTLVSALAVAGLGAGCSASFMARDDNAYRDATRELLMAKSGDIKSCYDSELAKQPNLTGRVVVNFKVAAETGKITDPRVDPKGTDAPSSLSQCVLQAISGVSLQPPDARDALATFNWEFKPGA